VSPRGFVILLAITVVAVIGAILATVQPTVHATDVVAGEQMFPNLGQDVADAGEVSVLTPQYAITWKRRDDGTWVSPERGDYPARKDMVSNIVVSLARMTKLEAKTAIPDWYQYIRVGDPAATPPTGVARVTVKSAGDKPLADAILGARSYSIAASHTRGGMFVRQPDEAQSWLVEGTASVPTELAEWFDTLVDIPGSDVTSFAILSGGKTVLEARKTGDTNGTYELTYYDPAEADADSVANSNSIRSTVSAIVGLRIDDVRAIDSVSPGDDARTDRFTTGSGLQLDVTVFAVDGKTWATFKASAPEGSTGAGMAADINSRTAKWAFQLSASVATRLAQPVANLVQKPADPNAGGVGPVPLNGNGMPMLAPPGQGAPGPRIPGGGAAAPAF
jgi:hypothetical protein